MPDETRTQAILFLTIILIVSSFSSETGRNERVRERTEIDTFVCGGEIILNGVCFSMKLETRLCAQNEHV